MNDHNDDDEAKEPTVEELLREVERDLEKGLGHDEALRRFRERIAPLTLPPCQQACMNAYDVCINSGQPQQVCYNQLMVCIANCGPG